MDDLGVFGLLKSLVIFLASEVFKPSIHVAKQDSELMEGAGVDENMYIWFLPWNWFGFFLACLFETWKLARYWNCRQQAEAAVYPKGVESRH